MATKDAASEARVNRGFTARAAPYGQAGDAVLALLLLGIVVLMIIPIPTPLLDILIASNLGLAVLLLLSSMSVPNGLAFTAMPTVLLCTTLYRLALNVSSTRLILLQADAGRVIRAFGDYVVRGNYAVGAVVFFILTLIQYVVVARGSERVAEVGARFSLDAMPGKQLAIDSDLRAGAIGPDAARAARRALERESQFYGAMDGAMKFVKGDAIAGIVITLVNVFAGLGIGVGMRGMSALESLRVYGLLTIGDGLVCQIPSLLISTGAGLVVTRVASLDEGASLGTDIGNQMFGNPRVLAFGAGFLLLLALVPGLPALPFGLLAALLALSAHGLTRTARARALAGEPAPRPAAPPDDEPRALELGLGTGLAQLLAPAGDAPLQAALERERAQIFAELGLWLPEWRAALDPQLPARSCELGVFGARLTRLELPEAADERSGADAIAAAFGAFARRHAGELFDLQQTEDALRRLERGAPALVRDTVPDPVPLRLLSEVLRRLLREGVSIRPLARILETLALEAGHGKDPAAMAERVRRALGRQLSFARARNGVIALHALDPMIEDALREALAFGAGDHGAPALPPDQARAIVAAVRSAVAGSSDSRPVTLVTQPALRRPLRALLETELPEVAVLSYAELAPEARVEQREPIRIGA